MSARHGPAIISSIWHLQELELYKTVKPYHLAFEPVEDIPRSNIERQETSVRISDLRCLEEPLSFHRNGFAVFTLSEIPAISDWDNGTEVRESYYPVIEKSIVSIFPGASCIALNHQIRKRDPAFPVSTGQNYKHSQPVRVAHVGMALPSRYKPQHQLIAMKPLQMSLHPPQSKQSDKTWGRMLTVFSSGDTSI
ncbi:hypothetical protein EV356DRAFT_306760 [Viridothelium virens]|uniref:Uncharacterized protein n=1 Tax=Viridothelium virens TaxID=1048519 RepID=A0A6A6HLM5_VIRVR|nr:hypothetical protein EV356DRAFT_306760 [Viridothelium virens]